MANKKQVGEALAAVEAREERTRTPAEQTRYVIFHRRWWKANPSWPDGLEPGASRPQFIKEVVGDLETARAACREWNAAHDPGRFSDKAEFQEAGNYYRSWPHKGGARG